MLEIKEENNQLIIKEIPLMEWLIGLLLFLIPFFLVFLSYFDKNVPFIIGTIYSLPSFFIFVFLMYKFPFVRITIDKAKKTISIEKRTLFNFKIFKFFFRELDGSIAIKEKRVWSQTTYQLMIPLKNNSKIGISPVLESSNYDYHKAVTRINNYIQLSPKQIP